MTRLRQLSYSVLLLAVSTVILFAVTELVLRARWEPRARTFSPNLVTRTTTSEYDIEIRTNENGFRTGENRGDLAPNVTVIGDSFVFGSGVAVDSIVTTLARAENFGVSGTGPFNYLQVWRDYARGRNKIVIVTLYAGNDASDALREQHEYRPRCITVMKLRNLWHRLRSPRSGGKVPSLNASRQGWNAFGVDNPATMDALLSAARGRGIPEDSVKVRYDAIPDSLLKDALEFRSNPFNVAEAVLSPDALRHNLLLDTPEMERGWAALETALIQLRDETRAVGETLVLVCVPAAVQVDSSYWWLRNLGVRIDDRVLRDTAFQDRLGEFTEREKIVRLDLLPAMRKHRGERLYYERDGHWNAAGHRVATEALEDYFSGTLRY